MKSPNTWSRRYLIKLYASRQNKNGFITAPYHQTSALLPVEDFFVIKSNHSIKDWSAFMDWLAKKFSAHLGSDWHSFLSDLFANWPRTYESVRLKIHREDFEIECQLREVLASSFTRKTNKQLNCGLNTRHSCCLLCFVTTTTSSGSLGKSLSVVIFQSDNHKFP